HPAAAHGAGAGDEPVGRCPGDEVLERATPALGGDDQWPVLDEGTVVEQVEDVLTGGPPSCIVTTGDGGGPAVVARDVVAFHDLGEVWPYRRKVHRSRPAEGGRHRLAF